MVGNFFFFPCGWKIALYHYVLWLLVSPPPPNLSNQRSPWPIKN